MRSHFLTALALSVLVLGLAAAVPAEAAPIHYGTGIYLWAEHCDLGNGHYRVRYVGSSICPNNPGPNCVCKRTSHDFPYDHPYPTRIAVSNEGGSGDTGGSGIVTVYLDSVEAIQCGVSVEPPAEGRGSCGDDFLVDRTEAWEVDFEIRDAVEALAPEIEDLTGTSVEGFEYFTARPLGSDAE